MTSRRDGHLENARGIRSELLGLLDGMDYCLDWKPDPSVWSVRQLVYHVLETPPGGIHEILWGMLSGELEEFEILADLDNITPDRLGYDIEQIREDVGEFFQAMEDALETAADEDFDERSALAHVRSRGVDEVWNVQMLLERLFDRHWRQHLGQTRGLREALGV